MVLAFLFFGSLLGFLLTGNVIFLKLLLVFFILVCVSPALSIGGESLKKKYPTIFKM